PRAAGREQGLDHEKHEERDGNQQGKDVFGSHGAPRCSCASGATEPQCTPATLRCKVSGMDGGRRPKSARRRRAKTPSAPASNVRAAVDRRRIAEEALRLIDADGLERLSMRRLGAELGVEGMAIYHHFGNKAELLDGVLELLLEELEVPPEGEGTALERLRRL